MSLYKILSNVQHNGELFKKDATIELDETEATQLLESGAIELAESNEGDANADAPLVVAPVVSAPVDQQTAPAQTPPAPTVPPAPLTPQTDNKTMEQKIQADIAALDSTSAGSAQQSPTPPAN